MEEYGLHLERNQKAMISTGDDLTTEMTDTESRSDPQETEMFADTVSGTLALVPGLGAPGR